ncbi:hypothetical protein INR49_021145 [Caranx melampygus]|nr:hypothetical protein INR49_021145 [Caranx melampygus]
MVSYAGWRLVKLRDWSPGNPGVLEEEDSQISSAAGPDRGKLRDGQRVVSGETRAGASRPCAEETQARHTQDIQYNPPRATSRQPDGGSYGTDGVWFAGRPELGPAAHAQKRLRPGIHSTYNTNHPEPPPVILTGEATARSACGSRGDQSAEETQARHTQYIQYEPPTAPCRQPDRGEATGRTALWLAR